MSTAKNKSSQDMIISSSLLTAKKKKNPSLDLERQKKKMLFSDQDAFLNDKMKRKKK